MEIKTCPHCGHDKWKFEFKRQSTQIPENQVLVRQRLKKICNKCGKEWL